MAITLPKSYSDARAILAGRATRKVGNNTYLQAREGERIAVRLHATDVVTYSPDAIALDSGGWRTVTTKDRMNAALADWRVFSDRGTWYVSRVGQWDTRYVYADGMTILPDGTVTGAGMAPDRKLQRDARAYARAFVAALDAGDVPPPGSGDCWYCLMRDANGATLGELQRDGEHIRDHIRESYYVPSLLMRAMETLGASQAAQWYVGARMTGAERSAFIDDVGRDQVTRVLRRYVLRGLGFAA